MEFLKDVSGELKNINQKIKLESSYMDYFMGYIYNSINPVNTYNLYLDIKFSDFEKILEAKNLGLKKIEKVDFFYNEDTDKLDKLYHNLLITSNSGDANLAISYSISEDDNDELIIQNISFYFHPNYVTIVEELFEEFIKNKYMIESTNSFYTIGLNSQGHFILNEENTIDINVNIGLNYGKKFEPVNDKIISKLKTETSGLFLFHGPSGGGKSYYLRYIIKELCNTKKIIYVPIYLMDQLSSPEFISFVSKQKNSILILEDAESILIDREDNPNVNAVSNLLNMTSGLLNDFTKMQIIATFNVDKKKIDSALLRPGRLCVMHKFNKLSAEEATALSTHIEKNIVYKQPMTTAEVYNGENTSAVKTKSKMGFDDASEEDDTN